MVLHAKGSYTRDFMVDLRCCDINLIPEPCRSVNCCPTEGVGLSSPLASFFFLKATTCVPVVPEALLDQSDFFDCRFSWFFLFLDVRFFSGISTHEETWRKSSGDHEHSPRCFGDAAR